MVAHPQTVRRAIHALKSKRGKDIDAIDGGDNERLKALAHVMATGIVYEPLARKHRG